MSDISEEWRKIEGTRNHYVSNFGVIKNFGTNYIIKQQKDSLGYCYVSYREPNSRKMLRKQVHRIVGKAFIPNPKNLPQIHHIDKDPTNNIVTNLRWVTNIENTQSVNKTTNIGYICKTNRNYYQAGFTHYGKKYQKTSKHKEVCQEWLKSIVNHHLPDIK